MACGRPQRRGPPPAIPLLAPRQMAARPGHPLLCGMGGWIARRMANESAAAAENAARAAREKLRARQQQLLRRGGGGGGGEGSERASADDLPPLGHDAQVLLRTGPGIWSDAVHR